MSSITNVADIDQHLLRRVEDLQHHGASESLIDYFCLGFNLQRFSPIEAAWFESGVEEARIVEAKLLKEECED